MRLALLIFALIASPALARDLPPEPPTYEKPTYERPTTPTTPPTTPTPTPPEQNKDPREPRPVTNLVPPPATALACPKVKCVTDENGHRRAMFTEDVPADMYYLGRDFCAKAPKETEVSACCLTTEDNTYQILYNLKVSAKAHKKATAFCTCVLGLD